MNNGEVGGSRGRGRGWKHSENSQPRELRRPKYIEDEKVEPVKSNLSAEAKEWYPPNYVQQQTVTYAADSTQYTTPRFSVQNRIRQAQDQNLYNFEEMSYSINEESVNPYLRDNIGNLINVMCEITLDPGKFDALCGQIVDSFASTLSEVDYTRPLVEAIVNQSIAESNFRYNGARLCSIYDSLETPEESTFRACLLERCSAEENKIITGKEVSEENIRGFAMFLAEIYTQLEDRQGGRIKSLGESLCKVLTHLLDTDKEINIKAVCQLLKLSGLALDADCPASMHAAFERLKRRSELACVRSVMALRAARWGLAETDPLPHAEPAAHRPLPHGLVSSNGEPEGGYLADGQTLTAEEAAFLQRHLPQKPPALDEDILDELEPETWDNGMDEEMQAGFLEFLMISNQIKR